MHETVRCDSSEVSAMWRLQEIVAVDARDPSVSAYRVSRRVRVCPRIQVTLAFSPVALSTRAGRPHQRPFLNHLNLSLAGRPCVGHIGLNGDVAEWLKAAVC